jgi:thioredoxin reductase
MSSKNYDVIIVGGSYSGLAAGLALGRALRKVLIIDNNKPCNRRTPHSHNFITQDGKTPGEISALAKTQVEKYSTVSFFEGEATTGIKTKSNFEIQTSSGEKFTAGKLIFATGIRDLFPEISGYSECWGISVLHCPYCHGYEVKNEKTGILSNGDYGFEFSKLISNWTKDLTLFTNGKSVLTAEQTDKLIDHGIQINESEIEKLDHLNGQLQKVVFKDGSTLRLKILYTNNAFEQHCAIPQALGCELTDDGYLKIDHFQKTIIHGVFACGDNTTRMRTIASAVAHGTAAGMMVNKEMVLEVF